MPAIVHNPWFYWPVSIVAGIAFLFALAAYMYNANYFPKDYAVQGFEGPTRKLSENGWFGALLPLAGLVSDKVREDPRSIGLIAAMVASCAVAATIGFWLYHHIDNLKSADGKKITIPGAYVIALQGVVYVGYVSAGIMLVVFLFVSPLFGAPPSGGQ
jgi:hypothetical protein